MTQATKKEIKYGFWQRATIPWKLACESENSRDKVVNASRTEKDKEGLNETWILWLGVVAYVLGGLASIVIFTLFILGKFRRSESSELSFRLG